MSGTKLEHARGQVNPGVARLVVGLNAADPREGGDLHVFSLKFKGKQKAWVPAFAG
jgi:hypothetical protein